MTVKVVTDSTCDLPRDLAEQLDISVIPCNIHFGDDVYKDGIDIGPDEFYSRLVSSSTLPTTAQPSVNDFLQVYKDLSSQGHDVVSVHLSAKLSGTLNSATQGKAALESSEGAETGNRVEIVDSQLASLGLGAVVFAAAKVAKDGGSCDDVVAEAESTMSRTHCYFLLDTLEYLRKGGRIGKASAFLGSLLSVKPVLTVTNGEAHPFERVRTRVRGMQKLEEIARSASPVERLCIIHSTVPGDAEALGERLGDLISKEEIIMSRFGPVLGTYLGPGALGVSVTSAR